jgi:hypothetical protein
MKMETTFTLPPHLVAHLLSVLDANTSRIADNLPTVVPEHISGWESELANDQELRNIIRAAWRVPVAAL